MNNSAINVVNSSNLTSDKSILLLTLAVGFAIAVIGYYLYYKPASAAQTPYLDSLGALQPSPELPPVPTKTTNPSWCLVAEDNSGRYCVKVPGPDSCEPGRTYDSQQDCELTPAVKLPASIQKDGGMSSTPLRDVKVR